MYRNPATRTVARCVVALGILLSMLLAGGAPGDFSVLKQSSQTLVAP